MKVVIMAGGKGTRISELFPDIPKPLIPVTNCDGISKPVLEWEIDSLVKQGFTDIVITVSHMHEKIENYFGDGSKWGANISYYVEETPLGNAGALFKMGFDSDFLLLNADAVFDVDFNRMVEFHRKKGAAVTLFTHPNSHPYDSGLIIEDTDGSVLQWLTKEDTRPQFYNNCVNAGLHIISPLALEKSGIDQDMIGREYNGKIYKVDLDRNILKPLCGSHTMFSYRSPEYVKDMGTPERFAGVSKDFKNGIVSAKNLSSKQKAIFLDRDGTINKYVGFLRNIDEFELLPEVTDAIKRINTSGYLAVIVTNQPVIARGEVTFSELNEMHRKMETLLGAEGAYIDALYFCPHHPHKGYAGEIKELKIECDCRKPKPGMLIHAAKEFNIDLNQSWMIGDGENDVKAGKAAGCKTALICNDASPVDSDIKVKSLKEAVEKILNVNVY